MLLLFVKTEVQCSATKITGNVFSSNNNNVVKLSLHEEVVNECADVMSTTSMTASPFESDFISGLPFDRAVCTLHGVNGILNQVQNYECQSL
jgi:hypothetical protein